MKKAVIYGAGNIGRGFIGQLLFESGYETCFIDVDERVISEINTKKEYPVKIVSNKENYEINISNIYAVNGRDIDKVAYEILNCDIIATSVGVNVLPNIIKSLSQGIKQRCENNKPEINILICENLLNASEFMYDLISKNIDISCHEYLKNKVGLIETSIGRMVPVMTPEMRGDDFLRVWAEPYCKLPVDKDAFKGNIPSIKNMEAFSPFSYFVKRKLYIHNMGHAVCAYLGNLKGYEYIYEAIEDDFINKSVRSAMTDSAYALSKEYSVPFNDLLSHIDDLLYRFSNRSLGDTIERVGRDPERKLKANDRLTGAALYCISQDIAPDNIAKGIAAALIYLNANEDIGTLVNSYCGIDENHMLYKIITDQYINLLP